MVDQVHQYLEYRVDYSKLDPFKVIAQSAAETTTGNAERLGWKLVKESVGESATVYEIKDRFLVFVAEGLGSKSFIAYLMKLGFGKERHGNIAHDLVTTAVNDGVSVGADILWVGNIVNAGDNNWFADLGRAGAYFGGMAETCNSIGAENRGGESQTLNRIVSPEVPVLNVFSVGQVRPKRNLTLRKEIRPSDQILMIPSSGLHTNYFTAAIDLIPRLPKGLATMVDYNGEIYGEVLLTPSNIYQKVVRDLMQNSLGPVYMSHITGHGLRKVMRATADVGYVIETLPEIDNTPEKDVAIFKFIKDWGNLSNEEAYSNMNMGCGFALIVRKEKLKKTLEVCKKHFPTSWHAGYVTEGPKRVELRPVGVTFKESDLEIR